MFMAALSAVLFALLSASVACAALVNTVTVTGSSLGAPVTATATRSISVAPANPALTLTKTGTLNDGGDGHADPGDTISYTFTVTNSGNITLGNVTLSDAAVSVSGGPIATLAPGAADATTFTATYTLSAADVAAGSFTNAATATADVASGGQVTAIATVTTPLLGLPAIAFTKAGTLNDGGDGIANVGDTISYQFTVTNTGTVPLTNVSVSDPKLDFAYYQAHGSKLALAAAADPMTTGSIDPPRHRLGSAPAAVPADVASFTTDRARAPQAPPPERTGLVVSRIAYLLAAPDNLENAPVQIAYGVTNTGDVPLAGVRLWSPEAGLVQTRAVLAPGETDSATFVVTHQISAEEAQSGVIADSVVISAAARGGRLLAGGGAALRIDALASADDMITAAITPASVPTLAPGDTATFSATYTLAQGDLDMGFVDNTATASAIDPPGATITGTASAHVPLPVAPAIAVVKTATPDLGADNVASAGDIITYHFAVTNTGNVTLANVSVSDPLASVSGGPLASLAPGQTDAATFSATYALTQADVNAGQVQNQATATGTPPAGAAVTDLSDDASTSENDPTITLLAPQAAVALVKTAGTIADSNGNGVSDAGDTLSYAFAVTNTGNVTLTGITVSDAKVAVAGGPLTTLAPGASDTATFTASYVLTQADFDTGTVTNQATAAGNAPDGSTVSDLSDDGDVAQNDPTVTPLAEQPAIALVKTVASFTDTDGDGLHDTGDVIHYAFAVTNTGNVTLQNVAVADPLGTVTGGPLAMLAPSVTDTTTFHLDYTITATDMMSGQVTNQATADALSPKGTAVSDLSDDSRTDQNDATVTPLTEKASLALVKKASGVSDVNGSGLTDAGDRINYAFTVTNTGNITLTGITVSDPLVTVAGGPLASLAAGQSDATTFTASYVLTPADIATGQVVNQATAGAISTLGTTVSDLSDDAVNSEDDPTVTPIPSAPGLAVIKTVSSITDSNGNGINDAGDVIHYAFTVVNTGNTVLSGVTVSDPKVTVSGGPLASLGIGATDGTAFTAAYTITQADVNAGQVTNQATASASTPGGATVTDASDDTDTAGNDPTVTPLTAAPGIALVKQVTKIDDRNGDGLTDAGDVIHYVFKVTNTGNVTLTNVTVSDPLVTVKGGPLANLAPHATDTTTFSATYKITPADETARKVVNQATASGVTPANAVVSDSSDDKSVKGNDPTVTPVATSRPVLSKTALNSEIHRGEQATFEIVASKVTFAPVRIDDIMPPGFAYVAGSATANGAPVSPAIDGRRLIFTELVPDARGTIRLRLRLVALAAAQPGTLINNAELYNGLRPAALARARAPIQIVVEAAFDCGEIIGKVFDDKNLNGYADDGEPGIAAVRLATVNGLLITTDDKGRYHIPCAALPNGDIGSNFVLKLDPRTLPTGYRLTTENPRDVRLTRGKVVKLNFGAAIQRVVKLALRDAAFTAGGTALKPQWANQLDALYRELEAAPSSLRITYTIAGESRDLAKARLAAVKTLILKGWRKRGHDGALAIESNLAGAP